VRVTIRRQWAFAAAIAAAVVALSAAAALGDRRSKTDPAGDASPAFTDIRTIKHGHAGGKLRHVIRVTDANRATKHLAQLEIKARRTLYLISVQGVIKVRSGAARRVDGVRIRRRGNRVIFTFRPGAIGDPRRYRWAATVGSNDTSPDEFDRAPDSGYIRHRLR